MLADLLRGRLFRLVALAIGLYAVVALATDTAPLVLALNGLTLSVAAGVAAAYAPVAAEALLAPRATRGDVLALGIWLGWLGTFMMRMSSIMARDLGRPDILLTDYSSTYIFLALMAGVCHLLAPLANEGRVPAKSWLLFGAIVAAGVLIAFAVAILRTRAPTPVFHF